MAEPAAALREEACSALRPRARACSPAPPSPSCSRERGRSCARPARVRPPLQHCHAYLSLPFLPPPALAPDAPGCGAGCARSRRLHAAAARTHASTRRPCWLQKQDILRKGASRTDFAPSPATLPACRRPASAVSTSATRLRCSLCSGGRRTACASAWRAGRNIAGSAAMWKTRARLARLEKRRTPLGAPTACACAELAGNTSRRALAGGSPGGS